MRLHGLVAASAMATVVLSGCGGVPIGPNMTANGDTITVRDPEGKVTAVAGGQQYPSGIPCAQYPGSEIIMSMQMNEAKAGEMKKGVTLKSNDAVEKITQFYKEQLATGGWKIDNVIENSGMSNIHASKDGQEINVGIIGNNTEGNVISINII